MATPHELDPHQDAHTSEIEPVSDDADLTSSTTENHEPTGEKPVRPGLRFPTHGLEETRVIEKTGTNGKIEITEED